MSTRLEPQHEFCCVKVATKGGPARPALNAGQIVSSSPAETC